ncbi:hypothetical protein DL764_000509 [Monosporascus ibericus]|uniref:alpha-1,2-Mannosidase n=1 Tax=Monosporascus ibericus TaxID=155417 RepID=A0A4V1XCS0_9PEZI|nr:hypothetical protein DL764_000509 [Monosporascus ibericus]
MQRSARKRRYVAVVLAFAFATWWCFSDYGRPPTVRFAQLERHMNTGQPPVTAVESSFDWSGISFRYHPGDLGPLPAGKASDIPPIQYQFKRESHADAATREARLREVRRVFQDDWQAYRRHAWMKDALKPVSGGYTDQFSGWAATLVDTLDTLWIMGLKDEFNEAVNAAAGIDFGQSTSPRVNTFETNIRYLGGLLAAYDLSKRDAVLTKAVELGNLLYAGFNTENRMPVDFMDFERAKSGKGLEVEFRVVSASPGTLSLEMTRLSQLTGEPKYYDAISRVTDVFYRGQNQTKIPGLWPVYVSMRNEDVVSGDQFTLGGSADSLYEYLPKMHALLGGREPRYEMMARGFLETAKQTLLFRPMLPGGEFILIAGGAQVLDDGKIVQDEESEHLACYLGGIYAIAGKMFRNAEYVEIGAKLTLGCVYTYRAFPTGIGPERWNMVACRPDEECAWDRERFTTATKQHGEWKPHLPLGFTTAKDPRYILRPEAIESVFIMYRVTGNPAYMDLGWDMFTAITNGTRTALGTHASVRDVTKALPELPQEDYMEASPAGNHELWVLLMLGHRASGWRKR